MNTVADPARSPTFTFFGDPNFFFETVGSNSPVVDIRARPSDNRAMNYLVDFATAIAVGIVVNDIAILSSSNCIIEILD